MFDLLVYDRAQSAKLLRRANFTLPGRVVEIATLPTSELLILMREGRSCTLYLHGASKLLPTVAVEVKQRDFQAPLLIPLTARKLMGGSQGMNIIHASRAQFRDALRKARDWNLEVSEDVDVSDEQH